ncbi:MAG: RNA 2',3'-cyclic phosphodiesterase [Rhodobacteraceae bacterium]|nr:RNA 2',3'-cyclic phosphodiesterase [Paracoccaceae bacterium]
MIRAFVAIPLPEGIVAALGQVQATLPVARVVPAENLHLTVVFLGEVDDALLEEVHLAFCALRAEAFALTLDGLGMFGGATPRLVHAGLADSAPLRHLHARLEQAARSAGVEIAHRRYVPHVTLAYLNPRKTDLPRLERAVAAGAGFRAGPFTVTGFSLYQSDLGRHGARYGELAHYPLNASPNPLDAP